MEAEPDNTRKVRLNYADGTSYTVFDDYADLDNTSSRCAFDRDGSSAFSLALSVAFNRLVDPAEVTSIEVTVPNVPGGAPNNLLDENGDWLEQVPTKTVTYTPQAN